MSSQAEEIAPEAAPAKPAKPAKPVAKKKPASEAKPASAEKKKKNKKKGKGPGKYSQLVIDAIKTLGERSGSSLIKIYNEAKKVSWFDQQHGRVYLRYSIRALLQNDTLVQVKGMGANGSFKLNKKKFTDTKKSSVKPGKTVKPAQKAAKKGAKKKESVSGAKKVTPAAKKTPKPRKADKTTAVEVKKASKPNKAKQTKKTIKKA